MKRFLFTMMTLVALVLVANTTFGQGAEAPYEGSTHSYTVGSMDMGTATSGSIEVYLSASNSLAKDMEIDGTDLEWTLSLGATVGEVQPLALDATAGDFYGATLATGNITGVNFSITYTGTDLSDAPRYIIVALSTNECTNWLSLTVSPIDAPALTLAVTSDATGTNLCQDVTTAPSSTNTSSAAASSNMITYTITPSAMTAGDTWSGTFTMSGTASYTFSLSDPDAAGTIFASSGNSVTITNATSTTGSFDVVVTWETVENEEGTVVGTVAGSLTPQGGGSAITATATTPGSLAKSVTYLETPTMGGFTGL